MPEESSSNSANICTHSIHMKDLYRVSIHIEYLYIFHFSEGRGDSTNIHDHSGSSVQIVPECIQIQYDVTRS